MVYTGELEAISFLQIEEMKVHWKITDFNSLPCDEYYVSPDFEFLEKSCYLEIVSSKDSTCGIITYGINVNIQMDKTDKWSCRSWDVLCTVGIIKSDGSLSFIKSEEHEVSYVSNIEIENFFTKAALQEQESELMPSNNLTIMCKLERVGGASGMRGQNALLSNIKGLFTNKEHCDVILQLPDKEFQAHKFILAAQSPVFSAMFKHDTSEKKTGVVKISGCDSNSFQDFLNYLYSGDFKNISGDNALHLYTLSDRYDIQDLKKFCLEYMHEKSISNDHFFDAAIMAEETGDQELYTAVQRSFISGMKEILACDEWITFLKECSTLANKLLLHYISKAIIYHNQDLKKSSLDYTCKNVDKDNFFNAVIIAEKTGRQELYAAAQKFFNGNAKEILASDEWMNFLKERTVLANKLFLGLASKTRVYWLEW